MAAVLQALAVCDQVKERFGSVNEYHNLISSLNRSSNEEIIKLKENHEFQIRKLFINVIHGPVSDLGDHVEIRPRRLKF